MYLVVPIWAEAAPIDITTQWKEDWLSASVVNQHLREVTSHLGDQPSRRQSSRRQTNFATNQLGDTSRSTRRQLILFECLFRIDRTKQVEQESRAIAGKSCNAALDFEINGKW